MTSTFTWLDYSEHERRKALDVIKLFGERDTRDELAIGSVRDGFADLRLFDAGGRTMRSVINIRQMARKSREEAVKFLIEECGEAPADAYLMVARARGEVKGDTFEVGDQREPEGLEAEAIP